MAESGKIKSSRLSKHKNKKNMAMAAIGITIVILIILTAVYYLAQNSFFKEYGYENNASHIVAAGEVINSKVRVEKEEVYLPFDIVKRYIYSQIELDKEEHKAYVSLQNDNVNFTNVELDEFVKERSVVININLRAVEDVLYFPIKSMEKVLGITVTNIHEKDRVIIDKSSDQFWIGNMNQDAFLMEGTGLLSKKTQKVIKGENVRIYGETRDHYKVRTNQGDIGYIKKKLAGKSDSAELGQPYQAFAIADKQSPGGKMGLVWDYVWNKSPDRRGEAKLSAVDVISPTWFKLSNADGYMENKGDFRYVRDAQEKGYFVWALVSNGFDPDMTSEFLKNESAQDHFNRQILIYSGLYHLDGINIDFENIHYEDKDRFTAFVEKLTDKLHKNGLVVSIDVTIPSNSLNWSKVYDRKKLGQIVDYAAVMTYDEHWSTSPKSGSVASIGWVEKGIAQTLQYIPPEKVLLGLPFYTRLWEEEKQPDGKINVSSKAYGMEEIMKIIYENDAPIIWDNETGQYYAQYEKENNIYKVWIEEERSLTLKAALVEKYNLAGFAAWRKDFEVESVWGPLDAVIKQGKSYEAVID
jgi:spore germination protein YaaH